MRKAFGLALVGAALLTASLSATTVLYVPVGKSVQLSDVVLIGHVLHTEAAYNAEGEIVTKVHLLVQEPLKGSVRPGEVFIFDAWGGTLDGVTREAVGEAKYRNGDKVLVMLENLDGDYHTLGLAFGKWSILRDKNGAQIAVRSLDDLHMVGVTETPIEKIPLKTLRQFVKNPF